MTGGIEVFECEAEDVDDSVKKLWLDLAREMFEIEHFILPSEANSDKWVSHVRENLASKRGFLLVARSGNRGVGFVYANILRDHPLEISKLVGGLDDLYVLPEFRGRGVGKKLVVECLKKMKNADVEAVKTRVLTKNQTAINLYEKLGFKINNYGMIKQIP